jgi:exonuclease I
MKLHAIIELLQAKPITIHDSYMYQREYHYVFCTDLMSDALAMIVTNCNQTLLITGLANAQSLRTAEMMDIQTIVYCRNKHLSEDNIDLAASMELNIFFTPLSMFDAGGILYKEGLKTAIRYE